MTGNADREQQQEPPLSPEWTAEIHRRLDALKRGEMKTIPADEVMRSLAGRDKPEHFFLQS